MLGGNGYQGQHGVGTSAKLLIKTNNLWLQ
jgi:hypothetical protein